MFMRLAQACGNEPFRYEKLTTHSLITIFLHNNMEFVACLLRSKVLDCVL